MEIQNDLTLIKDDFGSYVMYDSALSDMVDLEGELVKIGSFFIGKYEFYQAELPDSTPKASIDRLAMVEDLLEQESQFQEAKLHVVEALMECYESITDVVEQ